MKRSDFLKKYTKKVERRISLRDDTANYGCVFLKEGKYCSIYEARPLQCKNLPILDLQHRIKKAVGK